MVSKDMIIVGIDKAIIIIVIMRLESDHLTYVGRKKVVIEMITTFWRY